MTPEERKERARKAANARWARKGASEQQSEALKEAVQDRWEAFVDPDRELPYAHRRKLAERALAAHMAGMRLARSKNQDPA